MGKLFNSTLKDGDYREITARLMDNVNAAFICVAGRAGSVLLQSLIDSHPETISFPGFHYEYDYRTRQADVTDSVDAFMRKKFEFFDLTESYFGRVNSETIAYLGDEEDSNPGVCKQAFKDNFLILSKGVDCSDRKNYFVLLHLALAATLGHDLSSIKYIVFHLHINKWEPLRALMEDFPDARLLVAIRDPRESIVGWRRIAETLHGNLPENYKIFSASLSLLNDFNHVLSLIGLLPPERLRYIDLNGMHFGQEDAVDSIAEFLSLKPDPTLYESTLLGESWAGNASDRRRIDTFDRTRSVYQFPEKLATKHLSFLNAVFEEYLTGLGYQAPVDKLGAFQLVRYMLSSNALVWAYNNKKTTFANEVAGAYNRARQKSGFVRISPRVPLPVARFISFSYWVWVLRPKIYVGIHRVIKNRAMLTNVRGQKLVDAKKYWLVAPPPEK